MSKDDEAATAEKKTVKKKKKSTKDNQDEGSVVGDTVEKSSEKEKKKKSSSKESKETKEKLELSPSVEKKKGKSPTKKSKKKKSKDEDVPGPPEVSDDGSINEEDLATPIPTPKSKAKVHISSPSDDSNQSPLDGVGKKSSASTAFDGERSIGGGLMSPGQVKKLSAGYFEATLEETREKLEKKIKIGKADRDKFLGTCEAYYNEWYADWENEEWLRKVEEKKNATQAELEEARANVAASKEVLPKSKSKCIKAALKVFNQLDEEKLESLEDKLVKGAIIAQAGPEELAKFTQEGKANEKLIKSLFNDPELMRDMLQFGGPAKYKYGNAMKIYSSCLETMDGGDLDPKWARVNKKIALACALVFAAGGREFDTAIEIDPVKRYKHFEEAHRKGELDPSFPHFSVWEMRQIVDCDAPNDQMKWIRDTVMNYNPHITFLMDPKLKYTYMLDSDVRVRKPTWTATPRTYPMILSGGGNQTINSWFGRFLLKSFGVPAWGAKAKHFEGFCRWTPQGWEEMNGAKWETCAWNGKSGQNFKLEIEARNKASAQEYWKKLVILQVLADIMDGDPNQIPDYEKDVLHPERLWRSLSIVSMELLFQTKPETEKTFERKGRSFVTTRNEKYLQMYEQDKPDAEISVKDGVVTIPASRHGFKEGHCGVNDSFTGGKQLNYIAEGAVEYELPADAPDKVYSLKLQVCTVSAIQTPLTVKWNDADDSVQDVVIPYTVGSWDYTNPVDVKLGPGSLIRLSRPKGSLGLAVKQLVLS